MAAFKHLLTLLSVVVLVTAQGTAPPMCNIATCAKDIAAIAPAVASCITAGQDLAQLADDDDDDRKKAPKPDATKVAKDILDCTTMLITTSLTLPGDCGPCLNAIGNPTAAPAPAPASPAA